MLPPPIERRNRDRIVRERCPGAIVRAGYVMRMTLCGMMGGA